jgi:alpha-glucosidase
MLQLLIKSFRMKRPIVLILILAGFSLNLPAIKYELQSPDNKITVTIDVREKIYYSVAWQNIQIIEPSAISMTIDENQVLGHNSKVKKVVTNIEDQKIYPPVKEKRKEIIDRYNEMEFSFAGNWGLVFRAYDDGISWRFTTDFKNEITVFDEEATFKFSRNDTIFIPLVTCYENSGGLDCFHSSYEEVYRRLPVSEIPADAHGLLPALVNPGENRPGILITEADLEDYPGMYLSGSRDESSSLKGIFPRYPVEFRETGEQYTWMAVTKRADYIARTTGNRQFPWRVIVIAENDRVLAETDIVYRLSGECRLDDVSWIIPGKSTSEWLIANNIYGVDFKSGWNTNTYKYYIDFGSKFGLQYILFDAGWSKPQDVFELNPEMDMDYLTSYAREKNVGLVLWTSALAMEKQIDAALEQFAKWGVKGIMVDFMNRDDQPTINFLHKVAEKVAEKHIIVDFHGVSKPEGLHRKYPNVMTREGFIAYEYDKWSDILTPEYEVTIPFIRMVAGPMDYEPGTMQNAQKHDFRMTDERPMSQGTRIHQMAMFVVYESPYAKMGGNPSDYLREPEYTQFIIDIPTVWDETKVLEAKVSDYIITIRKAENGDFYVAGMTDWSPRKFTINCSFLDEGEYTTVIYQDGINADRYASDYKRIEIKVNKSSILNIEMAPGGGWVGRFREVNREQ